MKKTISFIAGAGIIVAAASYFIAKNPELFDSIISWALHSVSIS